MVLETLNTRSSKPRSHRTGGLLGLGFRVWGLGFGVWGLGFGVWGLGFWGLEFGVWGLGLGFREGCLEIPELVFCFGVLF